MYATKDMLTGFLYRSDRRFAFFCWALVICLSRHCHRKRYQKTQERHAPQENVGLFDVFDDFMQSQPTVRRLRSVGAKFPYDTRYELPDLRIPGYAASCLKLPYVWGQTDTTSVDFFVARALGTDWYEIWTPYFYVAWEAGKAAVWHDYRSILAVYLQYIIYPPLRNASNYFIRNDYPINWCIYKVKVHLRRHSFTQYIHSST